ncbi:translation initiation factor if-3 [Babesia caballi]|uniref:Translation initiation factor if-3 n=1 Tax=Babesia caballi TaxID=5871 RepID=A0AAV4LSY0_BABCB|nr:translation initiation factor if-3 [Babesia caballi]
MRLWAALLLTASANALSLGLGALRRSGFLRAHSTGKVPYTADIAFVSDCGQGYAGRKWALSLQNSISSSRGRSEENGTGWAVSALYRSNEGPIAASWSGNSYCESGRLDLCASSASGEAQAQSRRPFALRSFFGSVNSVFTDAEYDHRLELNKKYDALTDETDDSGLPLAPPDEDYEVDDTVPEGDADLSKPPSSKEEWYLKRMARGRRFWHKYFADPSQQSLRFYRLVKMKHDLKFCNRVVRRKYIELRPEIKRKVVDGRVQPLTRRERNLNRSRIQVVRTTVGYDNSSEDSNVLILLTLPQARLVRMVERIRLPHLLALRNFEMLRLLRHSMLFMAKPNIFESTVDFLLTFSRFNPDYEGDIPLFCELPVKPVKRFRPMIYAVIGRLRQDPFPDHLLKVRSSQPPPIREPFPRSEANESSALTRFLDSCASLVLERLRGAEYDFDAVMDRDFSDNFSEMMPSYTTKESVNRIDYPVTVSFSREMACYLREPVKVTPPAPEGAVGVTDIGDATLQEKEVVPVVESADASSAPAAPPRGSAEPWTREEVKLMLKRVFRLGLTKPSTLIDRLRRLHCDIGFSFEDLLWLGRTRPQLLRYGGYKQRCLQIYDCDEELTFADVLSMARRYPNLLTLNVARNVRPKIYYLRRVMRRDLAELVAFPKFLSYSLYDRIIPRHVALMNREYRGEFLKVYRFLFESGFYKGYGQTVTDEKVPDILPSDHGRYLPVYESLSRAADLRQMVESSDGEFIRHFELSFRCPPTCCRAAYVAPGGGSGPGGAALRCCAAAASAAGAREALAGSQCAAISQFQPFEIKGNAAFARTLTLPQFPVDGDIREPRVRVLRDGKFVGDFDLAEAQRRAREEGLNLILFRPRASPPVCVLARYAEFVEQQRPARERRSGEAPGAVSGAVGGAITTDGVAVAGGQTFAFDPSLKVKVVQISAQCAEGDFARKVQSARKFLEAGHRVELVVFTKSGRQGKSGQGSGAAAVVTATAAKGVPLSFSLDNPLIQRVDYIYAQLADVGRPFTLRSKVDTKQRQLVLKFWPA